MKKIWSILIVAVLMLSFIQAANAEWRGRCYHSGWGYGYRAYVAPVPAPCYRPYYAPAPVFQDRWVQPHYRSTP